MKRTSNNKMNCNKSRAKSQGHSHPNYPLRTDSTGYLYKNGKFIGTVTQTDLSSEPSYTFPAPKKPYTHKFSAYQSFIDWIKALPKNNDILSNISFIFDKDGNCEDVNGTRCPKEYLECEINELKSTGCLDPIFYSSVISIYDSSEKQGYNPDSFHINNADGKYIFVSDFKGQPKGFIECENGLVVPIVPNSIVFVANLDSGYFNPNDVLKMLNAGYKITNTSDLDWQFTNYKTR